MTLGHLQTLSRVGPGGRPCHCARNSNRRGDGRIPCSTLLPGLRAAEALTGQSVLVSAPYSACPWATFICDGVRGYLRPWEILIWQVSVLFRPGMDYIRAENHFFAAERNGGLNGADASRSKPTLIIISIDKDVFATQISVVFVILSLVWFSPLPPPLSLSPSHFLLF